MSEIEIIRVDPLELPWEIVWGMSGRHHITQKDFYVYVQETKGKMYFNKSIPEEDIEKMIEAATFPGRLILGDGTEMGGFMDYVLNTYGCAAYLAIFNYHTWRMKQWEEQRAEEKIKRLIPSIEKMINAKIYDEYMIYEAYEEGKKRKERTAKDLCGYGTIYTYCLGYLAGAEALGKERTLYDGNAIDSDNGNVIDFYYGIIEMLEHIDLREMPKIYGYLKEMYFPEDAQKGGIS